MKETCGDCRRPKMRTVDGKRVAFCPKKNRKVYLTRATCTDPDLKIIKPYAKQPWGTAEKIIVGIHQNEERTC